MELLGSAFGGIVVSDRFFTHNHLPVELCQLCWAHLMLDLTAMAERALRQSVIQRKISHGVQSASGANCRSKLPTDTTTLRQQGRDGWEFLEQAWVAHRLGGDMPSLIPDR
jgi:hypothetical protein